MMGAEGNVGDVSLPRESELSLRSPTVYNSFLHNLLHLKLNELEVELTL